MGSCFRAGVFAAALLGSSAAMADDSIRIDITATIVERCGISRDASAADASAPDMDKAQQLRFPFKIDCNTPFAIGVSSQNGALRLSESDSAARSAVDGRSADGFANEKAYDVALNVETDGAPMQSDACSSRTLTGKGGKCAFYGTESGSGLSSGKRTAINRQGALTVSWKAGDDGVRRAAGSYRDTLTVVVGPRT